jgi:hypothetical protein
MKNPIIKKSKVLSCKSRLELTIVILLIYFLTGQGQDRLMTIDGVYVERTSYVADTENPDSDAKIPEVKPYQITHTRIVNGDVIAFDIPGFNDIMMNNRKSIKNVIFKIDDIELKEFPAYQLSNETDVVHFLFSTRKLKSENRKSLYKLPGGATKEVLLGIKIDESNILFYDEPTRIFFKEIRKGGGFGWSLIIAMGLFFCLIIARFSYVLKDNDAPFKDSKYLAPRFSFSKSQFAFWTFIVLASFIYIWASTGDMDSINTTALILLGITSATITTSNLISKNDESKAGTPIKSESYEKTEEKPSKKQLTAEIKRVKLRAKEKNTGSFFEDILSDSNGVSIHRMQTVIFNLVFGIAFIKGVIFDYAMPDFTETQLILLGLSNGTYAFLKTTENK